MKIVSGRTGSPHVTSQQFRQMLEGIIGQGSYIVTSGENLKPELSSNNTLKIRSGMMCHHGCVSSVDIGTYDEVTLTNGSQGMKRIDLIVNRHTRNAETEIENCEWKVIMGTPAASNPIVPGYTAGNLQNGDTVDECPVFQVSYDGINVTAVKSLLETVGSLTELNSKMEKTELTNERIIGKVNGKNLYEKIVLVNDITLSKSVNLVKAYIPHDVPVINQVISCEVLCGRYKLPYIDETGIVHTFLYMVDEKKFTLMNDAEWKNYAFKFILRYTKYD